MSTVFKVVIPARYASTRLPGKPLRQLAGRPMLQHVHECARRSGADEIVVATDDRRIETAAAAFGANVCMTSTEHASGTERLTEVVEQLGWQQDTIVVNLQGDEPMMPPELIRLAADNLARHEDAAIATLASPITDSGQKTDPNVVKVVLDRAGYAMYFSRAPIPWQRDSVTGEHPGNERGDALHHIGMYAYRAGFLLRFRQLEPSPLEVVEKLEQLRALWHGLKIHVGIATTAPGPGVDTEADLLRAERLLQNPPQP
jgi:3-deoxy-manno-octulosonate cytidylyltransferase (CMP-KDO synthetase)